MRLRYYILRRLLQFVFVLLGTSLILFVVSHVIPADPVRAAAGPKASPQELAAIREKLGFDKPLHIQYIIYIGKLLQGDLGRSVVTLRPVIADLSERLPATLELALFSLIITTVVGILMGILSAQSSRSCSSSGWGGCRAGGGWSRAWSPPSTSRGCTSWTAC